MYIKLLLFYFNSFCTMKRSKTTYISGTNVSLI